jgi:type I restriction enzyme S subunit
MNNKLPKYDKYKPSGVEWLGEIPEHWEVKRLKVFAKIQNGQDYKLVEAQEGYPVYGSGGIFRYATQFLYDKPSVLLGRKGTVDKPIFVENPFWTVDTMFYTEIVNKVNHKFFYYSCLLIPFNLLQTGSTIPSMTQFDLGNTKLCFPPLTEQTRIAEFLDRKTVQIDQAIGIKEKQIALLKERRQLMIHRAVTKGLNHDAKDLPDYHDFNNTDNPVILQSKRCDDSQSRFRHSGVEWIGDIPEHWEVKKLKYIIEKSFSGGTPSTDKLDFWDGGIPWVSSVDVKKDYLFDTTREISIKGLKNSSSNLAPKGAVIFVTRSGILQHTFAISILGKEMAINQDRGSHNICAKIYGFQLFY